MLRCLQSRLPAYGSRLGVQTGFFRLCSSATVNEIQKLVEKDDVVLFMKGTPEMPRCGFSGRAALILAYYGVKLQTYDVLQTSEYRHAVKEFSKWPTFPQIFLKGEFFGGYDLLKEKHVIGELLEELKNRGIEVNVQDKGLPNADKN